jgi:hypothetical protein
MIEDDFNLETFVDLFDTAMMSDNPTVKKAFKNLMLVATLVNSENDPKIGPLREMVKTIEDLQQRVRVLEANKYSTYGPVTMPATSTQPPTWIVPTPTVGSPQTYNQTISTVGIAPTYTSSPLTSNLSYSLDNVYNKLDGK